MELVSTNRVVKYVKVDIPYEESDLRTMQAIESKFSSKVSLSLLLYLLGAVSGGLIMWFYGLH